MSDEWQLNYRDITGRKRELQVVSEPSAVKLVFPTGDQAVFSPLEVGRLRAALRDAAASATAAAEHTVWRGHARR